MPPPPKSLSIFTQAWSRMIHFYPLNPPMCQLRVRNVGFMLMIVDLGDAVADELYVPFDLIS